MILRPRLKCALLTVLLLLGTPFAYADAIDRFPLRKVKAERPMKVAVARDHVWVAPAERGVIAKVGLDGTVVDAYAIFGGEVWAMAADRRDGSVWYVSALGVGRLTPSGENLHHYLPQIGYRVNDIVIGSDDNIWVSTPSSIFRVTRDGNLREFPMQPLGLDPHRITVGPDYNLWISFRYARTIGKLTPNGVLTRFPFTTSSIQNEVLGDLAKGSDGSIWFTTNQGYLFKMTLSGETTQIQIPSGSFSPGEMVEGEDGALYWSRAYAPDKILRFDPKTHQFGPSYAFTGATNTWLITLAAGPSGIWGGVYDTRKIFNLPYGGPLTEWNFTSAAGTPDSVAPGPDGSIWVVQTEANRITRRAQNGEQTAWDLPAIASRPIEIVQGPDNAMYFTEEAGDQIGRIGPDGVLTEIAVPTPYKKPTAITRGPDGNLWFTLVASDKVVRMTPGGTFTEFSVPGIVDANRNSIVTGPDGNLWFTQKGTSTIGRMTPAGEVTQFAAGSSQPHSIVSFDGDLWYLTVNHLVRMSTTGVLVNSYPNYAPASDMTVGPDGALWISRNCCFELLRVTAGGTLMRVPLGTQFSPRGITAGADGNIWFVDGYSEAIVRVKIDKPITAAGSPLCLTQGGSYSGVVASFTDSDPAGKASDFTATINWGDGTAVEAGTVVARSGGGFDVIGSHQYSQSATFDATVKIAGVPTAESIGGSSAAVAVRAVPNAPVLAAPVQICANRTASAMVTTATSAARQWQISNGTIDGSTTAASVRFTPHPNATNVTLTVTVTMSGVCPRVLTKIIPISNCPSSGDMDGDGRAEIIWRNEPAGGNAYWKVNGTQVADAGYLPARGSEWKLIAFQDMDGDGRSDILWRSSYDVVAWYMNGPVVTSSTSIGYISSGTTIEAAGDFDGNSLGDLLLRNRWTNETFVRLVMHDGGVQETLVAKPPMIWQLQGSGDFNGDGKADILWRNSDTHEAAIWLMNGGTIISGAIVASPHSIWSIRGMGDVNGDGRYDIIWRNTQSSEVVAWLMNGAAITGTGYLATPSPDWDLKAIGDFDGDGRADAMWRNGVTGDNAIWLLNGTSIKAAGYVDPIADLNWVVAGPR